MCRGSAQPVKYRDHNKNNLFITETALRWQANTPGHPFHPPRRVHAQTMLNQRGGSSKNKTQSVCSTPMGVVIPLLFILSFSKRQKVF